jgi:hypothetical protein
MWLPYHLLVLTVYLVDYTLCAPDNANRIRESVPLRRKRSGDVKTPEWYKGVGDRLKGKYGFGSESKSKRASGKYSSFFHSFIPNSE